MLNKEDNIELAFGEEFTRWTRGHCALHRLPFSGFFHTLPHYFTMKFDHHRFELQKTLESLNNATRVSPNGWIQPTRIQGLRKLMTPLDSGV